MRGAVTPKRLSSSIVVAAAHVRNDAELNPNYEIDSWAWFSPEDAQKNLRPETLAGRFLNAWLEEKGAKGDESACTFEAPGL